MVMRYLYHESSSCVKQSSVIHAVIICNYKLSDIRQICYFPMYEEIHMYIKSWHIYDQYYF